MYNNTERYNQIVVETFDKVQELARVKGGEYAMEGDRLDNFRRNAAAMGVLPETCWGIYAGKHWDAIQTYIRDMQEGCTRERSESITGRADDLIVYLTLFKLMVEEREGRDGATMELFGAPQSPGVPRDTDEAGAPTNGLFGGKTESVMAATGPEREQDQAHEQSMDAIDKLMKDLFGAVRISPENQRGLDRVAPFGVSTAQRDAILSGDENWIIRACGCPDCAVAVELADKAGVTPAQASAVMRAIEG